MNRFLMLLPILLLIGCKSTGQITKNSDTTELRTYLTQEPLSIDAPEDHEFIKKEFDYHRVLKPSSILGGLTPRVPMAEATYTGFKKENYLWGPRGMAPIFSSLVVKSNDSLILIDSKEKFIDFFAPIESEEEALSYVAYLTRTFPRYDVNPEEGYRVYSEEFPSTYVKEIDGGYEVLLHDYQLFGCGPHPHFYIIFHVTTAGEIELIETVKMFEDPEQDDLCVD